MPGREEGITGATLGGYNLGINKLIDEEHREAALKVFKYFFSEEMQKKVITKYKFYSALPYIYEHDDVCGQFNCESIRRSQLIARPSSLWSSYSAYSERFRNIMYEYLFEDKPVKEVLQRIVDLSYIYTISLNPKESLIGIAVVCIVSLLSIVMLLSFIVALKKSNKPSFVFLPNDFWFFVILGSCIIMSSLCLDFGTVKTMKCHYKIILLIIGFNFNIIPVLYKLVINFPQKNKYSFWISRHRYVFISIFFLIDIIGNGLLFIHPMNIVTNENVNGKRYNTCEFENTLSKAILNILISIRLIIFIVIIFLLFLEWNLKETLNEIKFILSVITVDTLCFIILFMLIATDIKSSNFKSYYIIYSIIVITFATSNYLLIYAIQIFKLILMSFKMKAMEKNPYYIDDTPSFTRSSIVSQSMDRKVSVQVSGINNTLDRKVSIRSSSKNSQSSSYNSRFKMVNKMFDYHNSTLINE